MGKGMASITKSAGGKMQPKQGLKKTGMIASPATKVPIKGFGK